MAEDLTGSPQSPRTHQNGSEAPWRLTVPVGGTQAPGAVGLVSDGPWP